MKKTTGSKLKLAKETVRRLTDQETRQAAGRDDLTCESTCFTSCPYAVARCWGEVAAEA